jgi:hypothetical protein
MLVVLGFAERHLPALAIAEDSMSATEKVNILMVDDHPDKTTHLRGDSQ